MTRNQFSSETLIERFGIEATFIEVIRELESDVEMLGEVICGIEVNGQQIAESEESHYHDMPISTIQNLSIVTGRPFHLALGIIENWKSTLPKLVNSCTQVSSMIRIEGAGGAGQQLGDLFDACQYFVDSLVLLKSQFSHSDNFKSIESKWTAAESELSATVNQVFAALNRSDYNFIADMLEFDLCDRLEEWEGVITEVEGKFFRPNDAKTSMDRAK